MSAKTFAALFGAAVLSCLLVGQAEAQIPKGLSTYKLKRVEDIALLFEQVKDMNLSPPEMKQISMIGMMAATPGAVALTLDNKAPHYTVSFGGITIKFENAKTAHYKFLKQSGTGIYNILEAENKITGKNTLANGAVSELEFLFKGKEVDVTRKTKSKTIHITLEKI